MHRSTASELCSLSLSIAEAALLTFCAIVDQRENLNNGALNQGVRVNFNFKDTTST